MTTTSRPCPHMFPGSEHLCRRCHPARARRRTERMPARIARALRELRTAEVEGRISLEAARAERNRLNVEAGRLLAERRMVAESDLVTVPAFPEHPNSRQLPGHIQLWPPAHPF